MANDLNVVTLIGRLTRDMEAKYTTSGMAIGNFSIAVNRGVKDGDGWKDEASFVDCVCFGKTAENLIKYMTKGKQVGICGSLKQDRWTDKDGGNRSKIVVNCDTVQLIGGDKTGQDKAPDEDIKF